MKSMIKNLLFAFVVTLFTLCTTCLAFDDYRVQTSESERFEADQLEVADAYQAEVVRPLITSLIEKAEDGTLTEEDVSMAKEELDGCCICDDDECLTPIGGVQAFARMSCPNGWTEANGAGMGFYDNIPFTLATLGVLKIENGQLMLPDLRGEFIRGYNPDNPSKPDYGRNPGTWQAGTRLNKKTVGRNAGNGEKAMSDVIYNWEVPYYTVRPRNVNLLYCIKTTCCPKKEGPDLEDVGETIRIGDLSPR